MRSVSTIGNFFALRKIQLAETTTINFPSPLIVAALAVPMLGERIGAVRFGAIPAGLCGIPFAVRPGTTAFQPIALLAIGGVLCNAFYFVTTRQLAAIDRSETTLLWTTSAGVILPLPFLPFAWKAPEGALAWSLVAGLGLLSAAGHGMLIVAHRYAPTPVLTPFTYVQFIWMVISGFLVFGDVPKTPTLVGAAVVTACGLALFAYERRGARSP